MREKDCAAKGEGVTMKEEAVTKYPNCEVRLIGEDGHSLAIVSRVRGALRAHLADDLGMPPEEVKGELGAFSAEALSGDANHVIRTCGQWVTIL